MIDLARGVKSGFVSGILYSVLELIRIAIWAIFFTNLGIVSISIYNSFIYLTRLIKDGIIIGIIFSLIYDKIPFDNSYQKGVAISLIFYAVSYFSILAYGSIDLKIVSLILWVASGVLLGYFWNKFGKSIRVIKYR